MKKITLLLLSFWAVIAQAQVVNIPDVNFRNYLLFDTSININTNGDTVIQVSEAQAYTGTLNCSYRNISDMTGLEAFVNITGLRCNNNQLSSLDVSANTALTVLRCYQNQLTSLDVSANTALTEFYCDENQLTTLDVSANTALTHLGCASNQLTTLDVSANTALEGLGCSGNQLTSLDVSANTALNTLNCYQNQLTSLDVSANSNLELLFCYQNQLTSLDVSANTVLHQLRCFNNQLNSLNVANGNNSSMAEMRAHNNPPLSCIQHDSGFSPNSNWQKDTSANWSSNCNLPTPTNYIVQGTITSSTSAPLFNSKVYLIKYDSATVSSIVQDSTYTDTSGFYTFSQSLPSIYIKVVPNLNLYQGEIPTYYQNSPTFQNATPINLSAAPTNISFSTIAATGSSTSGGNGVIAGVIGDGSGKNSEVGNPIVGLSLLLVKQSNNEIVQQTTTNENGEFLFENLEETTFSIWVDKAGVLNNLGPVIALTEDIQQNNLKFNLTDTRLKQIDAVSINNVYTNEMNIYPNPTKDVVFVELYEHNSSATIEIKNSLGQTVLNTSIEKGTHSISLKELSSGMYFMHITLENNKSFIEKLIKHQ